jgi:TonB family protein
LLSILGRWTWRLGAARRAFACPVDRLPDSLRVRVCSALADTDIPRERIRLGSQPGIPAVAGLLRPAILLPLPTVKRLHPDELRAVLLHEESHRRRRDPLRALVLRGALLLFFFYPPLWWLARRLRESSESACDESVLEQGVAPAVYVRALVHAVASAPTSAVLQPAVGLGRASELQRRLKRIETPWRYRPMSRYRWILGAAALLVAVCCMPSTPLATAIPSHVETTLTASPAETAQEPPKKILRAGQDGVTKPKLIAKHKVEPKYPEIGLQEGVRGVVVLEAVVRVDGTVGSLKVVKNSTEYSEFAESAKEAIRQWRYEPAQLDGRPVEVAMTLTVNYHLDGK